jgi:N-acetylglucosaminyldiphosphoundecaprenol N-acetyl-beta-D-mannosaminyltransferase
VSLINNASPDVLLVGFGMPLQEKWIAANLARTHAWVVLSGGACLDYAAGKVRRGPPWMVNHGLEWLARLLIEPRRLWRRYLMGNPRFLLTVLRQRWRGGAGAR